MINIISGATNYRLSDKNFFDLSIGNRVLSDEVVENGNIPIYSANVFEEFGRIDKQNVTDFSVPSILWGIDGDWMVNLIPANKPFYPTDHCGVLRIKTDDIEPKYMVLALQVEGEFERFSRNNRASTQRISNLIIQVPSISDQQKVVDEIETIDKKISDEQAVVIEQSEKVKSKFIEMFYGKGYPVKTIGDVIDKKIARVAKVFEKTNTIQYLDISSIDNTSKTVTGLTPYILSDAPSRAQYVLKQNDIMYSTVRPNLQNIAINPYSDDNVVGSTGFCVLRCIGVTTGYMWGVINSIPFTEAMVNQASGANYPAVTDKVVHAYEIPIPPESEQNAYEELVRQSDKLKFEAQERLEKLNSAREELIDKYFK